MVIRLNGKLLTVDRQTYTISVLLYQSLRHAVSITVVLFSETLNLCRTIVSILRTMRRVRPWYVFYFSTDFREFQGRVWRHATVLRVNRDVKRRRPAHPMDPRVYTQTYTIYYFYPSRPDVKLPTTTQPSASR